MKINLQKIANPYMVFGIAWALCLILYTIGWSELFPKISRELEIFLIIVVCIFVLLSFLFNRIKRDFGSLDYAVLKANTKVLFYINIILWLCNFFYSGIPFFTGVRDFNFGIPTVIVFSVSLNSFATLCYFYLYLNSKKKIFLLYCAICLIIFALTISRGAIVMTSCSMFFLWLNVKKNSVTFKKIIVIGISICFVIFVFGVAGNYRSIKDVASYSKNFDETYNSDLILTIGQASDSFKKSEIPGEFFWTYLYVTSPLSNLQYNITLRNPPATISNIILLINNEIIFDSISKRIDGLFNTERKTPDLIVEQLTVCTTLAGSYLYAGWVGMIIFILFFASFPLLYLFLINKNPLGIIGLSVLCTIYLLSIFDNMITISALGMQLLYPSIIFFLNRIKFRKPVLVVKSVQ